MQQTKTYKLNLIETDDTFSPDPLNENMEKVEAQLKALGGADASLENRVIELEGHKIVTGYHAGTGTVDLGATPKILWGRGDNGAAFVFDGHSESGLYIEEGGFRHLGFFSNCYYIAFF